MKNAWISIGIFIVMLGGMFYSLNYLNKSCEKIENDSARLETLLNDEKWKEAYDLSNKLYYDWEEKAQIMPVFVNHMEIDALNNEILKLTQYVKTKSKDEALASAHSVKFYVKNIQSLQKVNIQNIF
ncbi:MAG: DUF4363 family protein [Bacillota bacterium]|nr:DUF4363 family protein [Bacillota bacterium]